MLIERSNVPGRLGCNFRSNGLYWLGKVVPLLAGFSAHDSSGIKVNIFMVAKLPVALVQLTIIRGTPSESTRC
jgi:hypothetical protein